ncbi:hypothetical protein BD324DRAFT_653037 [Kockovaella imperatae]|uniref:Uncharacterized protein n=1 Tax=Kockovaella imperatae TaxID=4999 RepID=A0A1Y1U9S4_9TREE|nr:hypothetical protein BD324DRAFT_653037 [Kockovaella imperatae]ORX34779.1 hypothetical protein BD324DRAFT_653037 [Kockovaella imperatae]
MSDRPLLSFETPPQTPLSSYDPFHAPTSHPDPYKLAPLAPSYSEPPPPLPPRPPRSPRRSILSHIRAASRRFSEMSGASHTAKEASIALSAQDDVRSLVAPAVHIDTVQPGPFPAESGLFRQDSLSPSVEALDLAFPNKSILLHQNLSLIPRLDRFRRGRSLQQRPFLTAIPPPPVVEVAEEPFNSKLESSRSNGSDEEKQETIQPSETREDALHPFAMVHMMMNKVGDESLGKNGKGKGRLEPVSMSSERKPNPRRGMVGAKSFIARFASNTSLVSPKGSARCTPLVSKPSSSLLRPAPGTPAIDSRSPVRYANASSVVRQDPEGKSGPFVLRLMSPDAQAVEIPRFKRRDLNLAFVKCGPRQRLIWLVMLFAWTANSLAGMFFDVNIMYMLVQCVIHSGEDGDSSRRWAFAASAYAVCWGFSTVGVWLVWEVYYEFSRRWRQSRPAMEPIYFSLPASVHLSLYSFHHFAFLLHIRLSPLGTAHAADIFPESCHSLLQLAPGLMPLLPRSGIGIVLLLTFWHSDEPNPPSKDPHFFGRDDGQLTRYAIGVILAFEGYVALRLAVILISALGLLVSSSRTFAGSRHKPSSRNPVRLRDPATALAPQRSWLTREDRLQWVWRDRSRRRLQDAFELCLTKPTAHRLPNPVSSSLPVIPGLAEQVNTSAPSTPFYTPGLISTPSDEQVQSPFHLSTNTGRPKRLVAELDSDTEDSTALLSSRAASRIDDFGIAKAASSDDHAPSSYRSAVSRRRAATISSSSMGSLSRARSTSLSKLKETVNATSRRVRSGTLLSADSQYSRFD